MKKTIFLFASVVFIYLTACKKTETNQDNPDVTNKIIDSSLTVGPGNGSKTALIDVNNDMTGDFYLNAMRESGMFRTALNSVATNNGAEFTTDGSSGASDYESSAIIDSSLSKPKGPRPTAVWNFSATCSIVNNGVKSGYAGNGDFFMGFYFTLSDGKHYGWLKLNVSDDGSRIILKELAYQNKPRTAIKVGEK